MSENLDETFTVEIDLTLLELFTSWELTFDGIKALQDCNINQLALLGRMDIHDIDGIFNTKELMADKINFKYHLQKWREENELPLLACCGNDRTLSMVSRWLSNATGSSSSISVDQASGSQSSLLVPSSNADVEAILMKSVVGQKIIHENKAKGKLNQCDQKSIVHIIVDYYHTYNIKMSPQVMTSVAREIKKLFPNEDEATYYVPRSNGKHPSGKLFDRYFNITYKRKSANMCPAKKIREKSPAAEANTMSGEEFTEKKKFLKLNIPQNLFELWKITSHQRLQEPKHPFNAFITDWPLYKDTQGRDLICIDFEAMFPGKGNLMNTKVEDLITKFSSTFFPKSVKEKLYLDYYKAFIAEDVAKDSRHYFFFMLLHTVLVPPRLNRVCKPTILDAQKDMVIHLININNFQQSIDELEVAAKLQKLSLQPKIFVVGPDLKELQQFYVYVEGIRYKVDSLIEAIDLVIKICLVFELEYSQKSKYVWLFLQEYLYGIESAKPVSQIRNIISQLQNGN